MKHTKRVKLEYSFSLSFTTRKKSVYVKLNENGLSSYWRTTGVKAIRPETFDRKTLVIPDNPEGTRLLQVLKSDILRVHQERRILRKRPDPRLVLDIAFGVCSHEGVKVSVVEAVIEYGAYHRQRYEAGMVSESSLRVSIRYTNLLTEFFTHHPAYRSNSALSFTDLKPVLADDVMLWLRSRPRSFSHNCALKAFGWLKTVINYAVANGRADRNPIAHVRPKKQKKEVVNLSVEQLDAIRQLDLPDSNMNLCRWVFLFCSYSGLAYADVSTLTASHLIEVNGVRCILKNCVKSDQPSFVPLFPDAASILEQFSDHPMARLQGWLIPTLSNTKTNTWLKAIGVLAGIKVPLTTHIARKSFTSYSEEFGFTMDEMATMMGHAHATMTEKHHYQRRRGPVINRFRTVFPDQVKAA